MSASSITLTELLVRIGAEITDYTEGIDKAISKAKEAHSAFDAIGKGLSAVLTVPLAAIGADAMKAASSLKEALNVIRVETGATGARLADLNSSFKTVFAHVPDSAREVGLAIGALNTRLGQTGKPLEELAQQMLELAHLTQSDLGAMIATTTRMFADWSIATNKQSEALDYLFKVAQGTGIRLTTLSDLIVQFGAPMRALGFSFEQAAVLLGKFEKEGVNMQTVMPGLRKELGVFAKAGVDAASAFKIVIDKIKNARTEGEGLNIALKVFGQRAATDMWRAIVEGRFEIDAMTKSFKESTETIKKAYEATKTMSSRMKELGHEIDLALEPIGKTIMTAMKGAFEAIRPYIQDLMHLAAGFDQLPQHTKNVVVALGAIAAGAGPAILALEKLSKLVVKPVVNLGGEIASGVSAFATAIKNVVFAVNNGMAGALTQGETLLLRFGQAALVAGNAIMLFQSVGQIGEELKHLSWSLENNIGWWKEFAAAAKDVAMAMPADIAVATGMVAAALATMWDQVIGSIPDSAKEGFSDAVAWVGDKLATIWENVQGMASKGIWQILMDSSPGFGTFKQAITDTINLIEHFGGKYRVMERAVVDTHQRITAAILGQTSISMAALEELAKRRGIDTRPVQDKATAPKLDVSKVFGDDKEATKRQRAAEKAAREYAQALETVGIQADKTGKLAEALNLVTKAFAQGKLTAEQYGTAVATVIDKEITAVQQLMKADVSGTIDPKALLAFRNEMNAINAAFAKGKIDVTEYHDALLKLQRRVAEASGTAGRVGLKHLGIPSHEELAQASRDAAFYFDMVASDATRTWYELDEARKKAAAAADAVDPHAQALKVAGLPSPKVMEASLQEVSDAYTEIWTNTASTLKQKFAIWDKLVEATNANDDYAWALSVVGLPSPEKLEANLQKALAAYDTVVANELSTWVQKSAARQAVINAEEAKDTYAQALKMANLVTPKQLKKNLEDAQKVYGEIIANELSTWQQKSAALQKKLEAQNALDPFAQALQIAGILPPNVLKLHLDNATQAYKDIIANKAHTWAQERSAWQKVLDAKEEQGDDFTTALKVVGLPTPERLQAALQDAAKAYEVILNTAGHTYEQLFAAWRKLFETRQQTDPFLSAMKALGVPTQEELDKSAEAAETYYKRIATSGKATARELNEAFIAAVDKIAAAHHELADKTIYDYLHAIDALNASTSKLKFATDIKESFAQAFQELDALMAKNLIEWGKWGDDLKKIAQGLGTSILRTFIQTLFKPLQDQLSTLAGIAATKLGAILGIFTGKTSKKPGGLPVPDTDGLEAGESAAEEISSTGGLMGVMNSLGNLIPAIGVAVNAISGIVQGIQGAHLNSLMDKVEKSTRGALNQLISLQNSANQYWPAISAIHEFLWNAGMHVQLEIRDAIIGVGRLLAEGINISGAAAGTPSGPVSRANPEGRRVDHGRGTYDVGYNDVPQPAPSQPGNNVSTSTAAAPPYEGAAPTVSYTAPTTESTGSTSGPVTTVPYQLTRPDGSSIPYPTDEDLNGIRAGLEAMGYRNITFNGDGTMSYITPNDLAELAYGKQTPGEIVPVEGTNAGMSAEELAQVIAATVPESVTAALGRTGASITTAAGEEVFEGSAQWIEAMRLLAAQQAQAPKAGSDAYFGVMDAATAKVASLLNGGLPDDMAFKDATVTFTGASVNFSDVDWSPPTVPAPAPSIPMAANRADLATTARTVNIYNPLVDSQSRLDSMVQMLESNGARF